MDKRIYKLHNCTIRFFFLPNYFGLPLIDVCLILHNLQVIFCTASNCPVLIYFISKKNFNLYRFKFILLEEMINFQCSRSCKMRRIISLNFLLFYVSLNKFLYLKWNCLIFRHLFWHYYIFLLKLCWFYKKNIKNILKKKKKNRNKIIPKIATL